MKPQMGRAKEPPQWLQMADIGDVVFVRAGGKKTKGKVSLSAAAQLVKEGALEWKRGIAEKLEGGILTLRLENGTTMEVDPMQQQAKPGNTRVEDDMCSLVHINEPSILENLRQRSLQQQAWALHAAQVMIMLPVYCSFSNRNKLRIPLGRVQRSRRSRRRGTSCARKRRR